MRKPFNKKPGGRSGKWSKSRSSDDSRRSGDRDRPSYGEGRDRGERRGGDRPWKKKSFGGDRDARGGGDRPWKKKSFDGDRDSRGGGDRPWKKKSFDSDRDSRGGGDRPWKKKSFDGDRDSRGGGDRPWKKKSFGGDRDSRGGGDRPWKKKSFDGDRDSRGGGDRPWKKKSFDGDSRRRDDRGFSDRRDSWKQRDERGGDDRPWKKKSFDGDVRRQDDRGSSDRRDSWKQRDERGGGDRPWEKRRSFDRKPYREKSTGNFDKAFSRSKDSAAKPEASVPYTDNGPIRLNKYLSNAGLCSRREADTFISAGVVTVNGKVVTEMGYKVNLGDVVQFGGNKVKKEKTVYILMNKPKGYITTCDDPNERDTVLDLLEGVQERVYPVGRLDRATTGLLLLTNDGELAKVLMHPKYQVPKVYHVELDRSLKPDDLDKIRMGIELEDGPIKPDDIAYVDGSDNKREVGIEIHSGRNRIVRRIFEALGYRVEKLDRVLYAGLTKKSLSRGKWRFLEENEVRGLKRIK